MIYVNELIELGYSPSFPNPEVAAIDGKLGGDDANLTDTNLNWEIKI